MVKNAQIRFNCFQHIYECNFVPKCMNLYLIYDWINAYLPSRHHDRTSNGWGMQYFLLYRDPACMLFTCIFCRGVGMIGECWAPDLQKLKYELQRQLLYYQHLISISAASLSSRSFITRTYKKSWKMLCECSVAVAISPWRLSLFWLFLLAL